VVDSGLGWTEAAGGKAAGLELGLTAAAKVAGAEAAAGLPRVPLPLVAAVFAAVQFVLLAAAVRKKSAAAVRAVRLRVLPALWRRRVGLY
jgi:hypothetical protein